MRLFFPFCSIGWDKLEAIGFYLADDLTGLLFRALFPSKAGTELLKQQGGVLLMVTQN